MDERLLMVDAWFIVNQNQPFSAIITVNKSLRSVESDAEWTFVKTGSCVSLLMPDICTKSQAAVDQNCRNLEQQKCSLYWNSCWHEVQERVEHASSHTMSQSSACAYFDHMISLGTYSWMAGTGLQSLHWPQLLEVLAIFALEPLVCNWQRGGSPNGPVWEKEHLETSSLMTSSDCKRVTAFNSYARVVKSFSKGPVVVRLRILSAIHHSRPLKALPIQQRIEEAEARWVSARFFILGSQ